MPQDIREAIFIASFKHIIITLRLWVWVQYNKMTSTHSKSSEFHWTSNLTPCWSAVLIWTKPALSTFSWAVCDLNISACNHIIYQLIGHEAEALNGTRLSTMIDEILPKLTSLLVRSDLIASLSDGRWWLSCQTATQINVRKSQAIHPSLLDGSIIYHEKD